MTLEYAPAETGEYSKITQRRVKLQTNDELYSDGSRLFGSISKYIDRVERGVERDRDFASDVWSKSFCARGYTERDLLDSFYASGTITCVNETIFETNVVKKYKKTVSVSDIPPTSVARDVSEQPKHDDFSNMLRATGFQNSDLDTLALDQNAFIVNELV